MDPDLTLILSSIVMLNYQSEMEDDTRARTETQCVISPSQRRRKWLNPLDLPVPTEADERKMRITVICTCLFTLSVGLRSDFDWLEVDCRLGAFGCARIKKETLKMCFSCNKSVTSR